MTQPYYQQKIFIPRVDEKDNFLGPIERWEAHEKGVLHRAFTIAVSYNNQIICQHRKHPVFDGWFDLTASSHPMVVAEKAQSNEEAVIHALKREWGLEVDQITGMKNLGSVIHNTQDPNSKYIEHELCHFFITETRVLPKINFDIAYGYTLQTLKDLKSDTNPLFKSLAPWIKKAFELKLL